MFFNFFFFNLLHWGPKSSPLIHSGRCQSKLPTLPCKPFSNLPLWDHLQGALVGSSPLTVLFAPKQCRKKIASVSGFTKLSAEVIQTFEMLLLVSVFILRKASFLFYLQEDQCQHSRTWGWFCCFYCKDADTYAHTAQIIIESFL